MKRKSFTGMTCPIARSLEHVGDWWNILILRDASYGLTRFDHFEESLGIAPSILTRRLDQLVKAGLLEKKRYSDHPPRYEYHLTKAGQEFRVVLSAFVAFGNEHFAPDGERIYVADRATGHHADLAFIDRDTRKLIAPDDLVFRHGRHASPVGKLRGSLAAGEISANEFIDRLSALQAKEKPKRREAQTK